MINGGERSIHFPPSHTPQVNGEASKDVKPTPSPAPDTPALELRPAIVTWGRMVSAAKHMGVQLKYLPTAEYDYHGTLRMILTAAIGLERDARLLLKMLDEGGGF